MVVDLAYRMGARFRLPAATAAAFMSTALMIGMFAIMDFLYPAQQRSRRRSRRRTRGLLPRSRRATASSMSAGSTAQWWAVGTLVTVKGGRDEQVK